MVPKSNKSWEKLLITKCIYNDLIEALKKTLIMFKQCREFLHCVTESLWKKADKEEQQQRSKDLHPSAAAAAAGGASP